MSTAINRKVLLGAVRVFATVAVMSLFMVVRAQAAIICLDPGHGGAGTAGAGALYPPYMEKQLNYAVASQVKSELEAAGHTVYMTRNGDVSLGLDQRAAYAKSVNADLLISIHFNSSGAHDKFGSEVWTSMFGGHRTTGYALGSNVLSQLTALGFASKGVKTKLGTTGDYYGIIRHGVSFGIPTIIIEHCFMDNPIDRTIMETKGLNALAHADAVGIGNYISSVGGAVPKSDPVIFAEGTTAAGGTGAAAAASDPFKTKYGFPKDAAGNVTYTDGSGGTAVFTAAEWNKLLGLWSHTGDPEAFLKQQSAADLKTLASR
jgi:N-acetylmuramoyl-L-alanine amidase